MPKSNVSSLNPDIKVSSFRIVDLKETVYHEYGDILAIITDENFVSIDFSGEEDVVISFPDHCEAKRTYLFKIEFVTSKFTNTTLETINVTTTNSFPKHFNQPPSIEIL